MSGERDEPPGRITLAILAGTVTGEDVDVRRLRLMEAISSAPDADLLVLPYLAAHPPFWERLDRRTAFAQAERPPAPSLRVPQEAAGERGIPLLASAYDVEGEGVFYAQAEVRGKDGALVCAYRQRHALNQPGLHERLYFQPGSGENLPVFPCGDLHIGLLMGGDLWVPEAARLLRLAGAEAILALTALPESLTARGETLAAARSIENGIPVVLVNRGGVPRLFEDGAANGPVRIDGVWSLVNINAAKILGRLRCDDPLWMRRPRLYASLARRWEEQIQ
jgi:predicted amidohydrolase